MAAQREHVDALIARIAARQAGAVSRRQLLEVGLSRSQVQTRIEWGVLVPIHRGVYIAAAARGRPLSMEWAAVLACGPDALLSHATAGRIWGLPVPGGPVHVTTERRKHGPLRGVQTFSVTALHPSERRRKMNLPLTSPSLTLLDLAGALSRSRLAGALNEARVLRLVREAELGATLRRHPQRRGAAALSRLLAAEEGPRVTRSEAERRALGLMRGHGLEPETNIGIGPWRVDFLFRAERVVVEVDGYRYHATPKRFVEDRRRTADLVARGFTVLSWTWDDLGPGSAQATERLIRTLDGRR